MRSLLAFMALIVCSCAAPIHAPRPRFADPLRYGSIEGIRWLVRHQGPDGSWSARTRWSCESESCGDKGDESMDVARTALALQAMLDLGWAPVSEEKDTPFQESMGRALQWLLQRQDGEGAIGASGPHAALNHAVGTLALVTAYSNCSDWDEPMREDDTKWRVRGAAKRQMKFLRKPCEAAINHLLRSRSPGGAWKTPVDSAWSVAALDGAVYAKLLVERPWKDDVVRWFTSIGESSDRLSIAATLAATCSLLGMECRTETTRKWKNVVRDHPPGVDRREFLFTFWGTAGLFEYYKPGMIRCIPTDAWQDAKEEALRSQQNPDIHSCARGSWSPGPEEVEGGRAWATVLAVRSLGITQRSRSPFGKPIQDD